MNYRFFVTLPREPFSSELWRTSLEAGVERVGMYNWTPGNLPNEVEELTKAEAQRELDLLKANRLVAPWVPLEGYSQEPELSPDGVVADERAMLQFQLFLGAMLVLALVLLYQKSQAHL